MRLGRINPITGAKELDVRQLNYRYEVFNYTEAAKRKHRLDPARRILNTDVQPDPEAEVLISKDTAFFDDDGRIITQTIVRPLQSEFDFLNTYIVNIYLRLGEMILIMHIMNLTCVCILHIRVITIIR